MAGAADLEDLEEVFDLFDFWDGRDGLIDAVKVGDLLRCIGLNPTNELINKYGGTKRPGEKQYSFAEFKPIFEQIIKEKDTGTFRDFHEAFKSFDREGQGYISAAELRYLLSTMGERLEDDQIDEIMKLTDIQVDLDGNLKYDDFINRVLKGPDKK